MNEESIKEILRKISAGAEETEITVEVSNIKTKIAEIYPTFKSDFVSEHFVPVLLNILEENIEHVNILHPIIYILFYVSNKENCEPIKTHLTLYLHILEKYIDNELICRNTLALLNSITKTEASKDKLIGVIIPLILRIIEIHNTNERVYVGVSRLISKLTANNIERQNLFIKTGLRDFLIEKIVTIVDENDTFGDIVDSYASILFHLTNKSPDGTAFISENRELFEAIAGDVNEGAFIYIDKMMNIIGRSAQGDPINRFTKNSPKGFETIRTVPAKIPKNVYTTIGHGREYISDEPIPVPPGCVYVTIALCGVVSTEKEINKLLDAFTDPKIRDKLRDPVTNLKQLTTLFGESLHVHYPEAENETSRTYFDTGYYPLAGDSTSGECRSVKSGLYRIGDVDSFRPPKNIIVSESGKLRYLAKLDCKNIEPPILRFLYSGALYPTIDIINRDLPIGRKLSYNLLAHEISKCRFSQSWAFSKFPGVHYNFICRSGTNITGNVPNVPTSLQNRIDKRRRNSKTAANLLIAAAKGGKSKRKINRKRVVMTRKKRINR